ncbi:hypothetical protein BDN72DRAFT_904157 [Pluteus cervinus]|uniref:Uncharacterized protein n=1 Tax=Pluteus cervinus TaxID=181527 RepID=A0ACD3A6S2_9AGAR|nr:hypothetical protein BDN72DRAFT_904157 [Pluteus cervinus]
MFFILLAALAGFRAKATPISIPSETVQTVNVAPKILFGLDTFGNPSCVGVRTLAQIVGSCLFTIAVSLFWAVRQNIPNPQSGLRARLLVNMKVVFYGLIAPEALLWWAMRQRIGARLFVEQMNQIKPELQWTITHGYFAQMGGFARKDNRKVLSPPTLFLLLKGNKLDFEALRMHQQIKDKNNSNALSNSLVAIQVTWFVCECLSRLHERLPLTQLEVVTLASTTLNVMTSLVWWSKPSSVMHPIYLSVSGATDTGHSHPHQTVGEMIWAALEKVWTATWKKSKPRQEKHGEGGQDGEKDGEGVKGRVCDAGGEGAQKGVRKKLASKGRQKGDAMKKHNASWWVIAPFLAVTEPVWELLGDSQIHEHAMNVPTFYGVYLPPHYYLDLALPSLVVMMIFGGIHFLSWHTAFSTQTQLLLWRFSLITLVGFPVLLLLTSLVDHIYVHTRPSGTTRPTITQFLLSFCLVLSFLGAIAYVFARSFILILTFLMLRNLSSRVLDDVSWTFYVPHL